MPTLSVFYGIVINMYYRPKEHNPPHFHALYSGDEALVDINTLQVFKGSLPRRAKALVLKWAAIHQDELKEAWEACSKTTQPKQIDPLD
jgi:hypothetical protein